MNVQRHYGRALEGDFDHNLGWIQAVAAVAGLAAKKLQEKKAKKAASKARDKARKQAARDAAAMSATDGAAAGGSGQILQFAGLGLGAIALLGVFMMGMRRR